MRSFRFRFISREVVHKAATKTDRNLCLHRNTVVYLGHVTRESNSRSWTRTCDIAMQSQRRCWPIWNSAYIAYSCECWWRMRPPARPLYSCFYYVYPQSQRHRCSCFLCRSLSLYFVISHTLTHFFRSLNPPPITLHAFNFPLSIPTRRPCRLSRCNLA